MSVPPVHVLAGPLTHGVVLYAAQLAGAVGADTVSWADGPPEGVATHLHFTDRLLGSDPAAAATAVERWCRRAPTTLTLHDVPQPTDGDSFEARRAAYARVVAAGAGWATNSVPRARPGAATHPAARHRGSGRGRPAARRRVGRGPVGPTGSVRHRDGRGARVPLPGQGAPRGGRGRRGPCPGGSRRDRPGPGAAGPHHDDLVEELQALAAGVGVGFEVTGYLSDADLLTAMREVSVGVAAHRNVSASGSMNSWLTAGRRPLVRDTAYAREMAALRPGCYRLFDDADLVDALASAADDPGSGWLPAGQPPSHRLEDAAAAYLAWWASR